MPKQQNTSNTSQVKNVEVSSFSLFGHSQKDKTIREYNQKGWILTGDEIIGKNKHRLTFELPPQEKKAAGISPGCATLIGIVMFIMIVSRSGNPSGAQPTPTLERRQPTQVAQVKTSVQPTRITGSSANKSLDDNSSRSTVVPTETPVPTRTRIHIFSSTSTPNIKNPEPTLVPTDTATEKPAQAARAANDAETYYASGNVKLRSCPQLTAACEVTIVSGGTALEMIDSEQGDRFNGSDLWYVVNYEGREFYVHSKLVSTTMNIAPVPAVDNQNNASTLVTNVTSVAPPLVSTPTTPIQTWNCSGNIYNCEDFHDRNTLMSYWYACPGDPSGLDGNDNDQKPCEGIK
ncbi:MAG TPA: hypothetical protein VHL11_18655 [Phototrophicaceae bacterium]|jgi:hypothetical protein|nr:hypothetical protein [Phototrophicaceae bacterium]